MYGLEKKTPGAFEFDLEKEIRDKPGYAKKIIESTEKKTQDLKKQLREGAGGKEFDELGIILHGYTALQKVLKKIKT